MSLKQNLTHEAKAIGLAALYFGSWIAVLLLLKFLVLAEYKLRFSGWAVIVGGALILSKVVLLLEHVSFGAWLRAKPAWVDVILRTALYSAGVVVVLILERGFEGRHEHGGFGGAVRAGFRSANAFHIYVNAICLSGALFGYNVFSVIRRRLGTSMLWKFFREPLPPDPKDSHPPRES